MSVDYFDSIEFDGLLDRFFSFKAEESIAHNERNQITSSGYLVHDTEFYSIKKKRKYYYVPVIRVLKTDVRRSFPDMFVNVWNSMELHMLFGFLDTYCHCNFLQESWMPRGNTNISSTRNLQGVVSVAKFWYTTMLLTPDLSITTGETQVIYSENKALNRVVSKFHLRGTRIFDTPDNLYCSLRTIPLTKEENELYSPQNTRIINQNTSRLKIIDNIQQSAEAVVQPFGLTTNPIHTDSEGIMTFYTDDDNRITKFMLEVNKSSRNCCQPTGRVLWPGYNEH